MMKRLMLLSIALKVMSHRRDDKVMSHRRDEIAKFVLDMFDEFSRMYLLHMLVIFLNINMYLEYS